MPYHWDDRLGMESDYARLSILQDDLLSDLAEQLNEVHGVDHGVRYWQILLGPWLATFVASLADRWAIVVESLEHGRITETNILSDVGRVVVSQDNAGFHSLVFGDLWNHVVIGRLLREETDIECRGIPWMSGDEGVGGRSELPRRSRREAALGVGARLSRFLARPDDAVLRSTCMPWRSEVRVQLALRQFPVLWTHIPLEGVEVAPDQQLRDWSVRELGRERFEDLVRRWISDYLPTSYLEGYQDLLKATESSGLPDRPKVIFTSNAHFSDEVFKAWTAERVERGAPLMIGQHGGHSGVGRFSATNDHEVAISDRFASWGWSNGQSRSVVAVGQLKGFRPTGQRDSGNLSVLLMLNVLARYGYSLYDVPVAGQWLDYFADQCAFVDSLSNDVRQQLSVRLFEQDFGWDQEQRWRERYPDLTYESSADDLQSSLSRTRVAVSTYNGSSFLETISMDVPTIIFWDPTRSGISERARMVFDGLAAVGVFHPSPTSAARHLSTIWDDVEAWWCRSEVRAACDELRHAFSRDPRDAPARVTAELKALVSGDRSGRSI